MQSLIKKPRVSVFPWAFVDLQSGVLNLEFTKLSPSPNCARTMPPDEARTTVASELFWVINW
jgi:hypothetical protein